MEGEIINNYKTWIRNHIVSFTALKKIVNDVKKRLNKGEVNV